MLKITSGLGGEHLKFNFSAYLDQLRELQEHKGDKNLFILLIQTFKSYASFDMVFDD